MTFPIINTDCAQLVTLRKILAAGWTHSAAKGVELDWPTQYPFSDLAPDQEGHIAVAPPDHQVLALKRRSQRLVDRSVVAIWGRSR